MTWRVPFADLHVHDPVVRAQLDEAYRRVMDSGWYLLGAELEAFEDEFASVMGAAMAVGVGSGLDALILALRATGIGPGDEVLVPSNTYVATWLAVSAVGATIVPVEPSADSFNISAEACVAHLGPRTKAILPVHLYGECVDMAPMLELARDQDVKVIVDAAQAHGASYRGGPIGALGDAVAWSFYPTKNLGAFADAGAVTTDDPDIAERVRLLRNYGSREKYVNEELGMNSRLDELEAALLRVRLRHLAAQVRVRHEQSWVYDEGLEGLALRLPSSNRPHEHARHLYVVRCKGRDALREDLARQGIQTLVHYPIPPHLQRAYNHLGLKKGSLPVSEAMHDEVLSLPLGSHLSTEQVQDVVDATRAFLT